MEARPPQYWLFQDPSRGPPQYLPALPDGFLCFRLLVQEGILRMAAQDSSIPPFHRMGEERAPQCIAPRIRPPMDTKGQRQGGTRRLGLWVPPTCPSFDSKDSKSIQPEAQESIWKGR